MSNYQLLYDYFDGEISESDKQDLFTSLASDDALRADFDKHLKIDLISKKDMAAISPPAHATGNIFTGLGFNIPSDIAKPSNSNNWKSIYPILLILLSLSLASTGMFLYFDNQDLQSEKANYYAKSNELIKKNSELENQLSNLNKELANQQSNYLNNIAQLSNINSLQAQNITKLLYNLKSMDNQLVESNEYQEKRNEDFYNTNPIDDDENANLNTNFLQDIYSFISNSIRTENSHYNAIDAMREINNTNISTQRVYVSTISNFGSIDNNNPKIFVYAESFTSMTSKVATNVDPNGSLLNNFSFGINYMLNDQNAIGIRVGIENFAQEFSRNIEGLTVLHNQNPELFFYGVNYRGNLTTVFNSDRIYPYLDLMAGGTIVGPLFRSQAGLEFAFYNNIRFNLGYDWGILLYSYDNNLYNSQNSGIKFGLRYGF